MEAYIVGLHSIEDEYDTLFAKNKREALKKAQNSRLATWGTGNNDVYVIRYYWLDGKQDLSHVELEEVKRLHGWT